MPFPGTDKDAYRKASKGKTPKQRSKIYYKEKAKNEQKLKQIQESKLSKHFDVPVKRSEQFSRTLNDMARIHQKRCTFETYKNSNKQAKVEMNIKQLVKNSNSIIWDQTLNRLENDFKDKILDFTLELIKEDANDQIEKVVDTYQIIEKHIKLIEKIYKVIIRIDKKLNKVSVEYEQQQNDEISQSKYKRDAERYEALYSKYEKILNVPVVYLNDLEVWHLGTNKKETNKLFWLVQQGRKIATSYLYNETQKLAKNSYSILTDWDKNNFLLIFTTNIQVVPFNKVTKQHARNEGEGTRTLHYWRNKHRKMFFKQLSKTEQKFSDETLIVCETFRIVKVLNNGL